ncbi:hypothetical protein AB205_0033780, partial [Aquarana catesbeiana]
TLKLTLKGTGGRCQTFTYLTDEPDIAEGGLPYVSGSRPLIEQTEGTGAQSGMRAWWVTCEAKAQDPGASRWEVLGRLKHSLTGAGQAEEQADSKSRSQAGLAAGGQHGTRDQAGSKSKASRGQMQADSRGESNRQAGSQGDQTFRQVNRKYRKLKIEQHRAQCISRLNRVIGAKHRAPAQRRACQRESVHTRVPDVNPALGSSLTAGDDEFL